jgi:hypothetical protein
MKKVLLFAFMLITSLPFGAFAATWTVGSLTDADSQEAVYLNDGTNNGELIRVSTNVVLDINSETDAYAVTSGHIQGQVQYGSTSEFNSIFEGVKAKGVGPTAPTDNETLDSTTFPEFPTDDTTTTTTTG